MKSFFSTILCLCMWYTVAAQKSTEQQVQQVFENYKQALLADDGATAVQYLDKRTENYYTQVLEWTLHADSSTIAGMRFFDKMMVLLVRHRTNDDDLKQMNGRSLMIYSINEGMVGKEGMESNTIGKVSVDGEMALGDFIIAGESSGMQMTFYKEDQVWNLNLTSIFDISEAALLEVVQQTGLSDNEFVMYMLQYVSDEAVDNKIWHPIVVE